MADDDVICSVCNRSFTGSRYYKAHLKYPKNWKCAIKSQSYGHSLPKKRVFERVESGENDTSFKQRTQKSRSMVGTSVHTGNSHEYEPILNDSDDELLSEPSDDEGPAMFDEDSVNYNNLPPIGEESDDEMTVEDKPPVDSSIWEEFKQYSDYAVQNTCDLPSEVVAGIELMHLLSVKRVPLCLYDEIYQWHLDNIEARDKMPRQTLLNKLNDRYYMNNKQPQLEKNVLLPQSNVYVDLVFHPFREQAQSLLTDPRIKDEDLLFFLNNPFQPPPEDFTTIGDINTGLAYRETYKKLITDPSRQVLLPIIMYMDAAITGQYDHLPIEALKFTLGIFNAATRDKAYAWRSLGYITRYSGADQIAREIIQEEAGMDAEGYLTDDETDDEEEERTQATGNNTQDSSNSEDTEEEDDDEAVEVTQIKKTTGQDLHKMLSVFLSSYKEVEDAGGFEWDLRYQGETHRVHFIPFILFVKGDGVEHDKHCGQYTCKTSGVSMLCRYCTCPTDQSDEPYKIWPKKSPQMIQPLVDEQDEEGLKALSQQYIHNSWYALGFGLHNDLGIHGATPLETLHWIQIGKYGYVREGLFGQMGKNTILANAFNALAKSMGTLFKRQSYRGLPRTNFPKGVKKGKLMAHEMTGLILIMLTCLRTKKGQHLLLNTSRGDQARIWTNLGVIKEWMRFMERLLQWEAWLNLPEVQVYDVIRSKTKVRELMHWEKKVAYREKGMEHCTLNFHATVHTPDDQLFYGVAGNVNSRSNEMHHKDSKTAAIRTQRRAKTFDHQCAQQLHNIDVITFGMYEVEHGESIWMYPYREVATDAEDQEPENEEEEQDLVQMVQTLQQDTEEMDNEEQHTLEEEQEPVYVCPEGIQTGGVKVEFFYCAKKKTYQYKVFSKMKNKHLFKLDEALVTFLEDLLQTFQPAVNCLTLYTEQKRHKTIFRGSPRFLGKVWRDWAMVDWGDDGILPGQIWIFVDLTWLPFSNTHYEPGMYCVVETAREVRALGEAKQSQLIKPYKKDVDHHGDGSIKRQFWLVNTECIVDTCCMIPDVGNDDPTSYLRVLPVHQWSELFVEWLHKPHRREFDEGDLGIPDMNT